MKSVICALLISLSFAASASPEKSRNQYDVDYKIERTNADGAVQIITSGSVLALAASTSLGDRPDQFHIPFNFTRDAENGMYTIQEVVLMNLALFDHEAALGSAHFEIGHSKTFKRPSSYSMNEADAWEETMELKEGDNVKQSGEYTVYVSVSAAE